MNTGERACRHYLMSALHFLSSIRANTMGKGVRERTNLHVCPLYPSNQQSSVSK